MYAGVTITDGQEENTILMISKRSRKFFYLCIFTYTRPEFGVRQEVSASDSDETPFIYRTARDYVVLPDENYL